jgi:Holliday junction resolvase-like predicted endonuclease
MTVKDAAAHVAEALSLPRRQVYQAALSSMARGGISRTSLILWEGKVRREEELRVMQAQRSIAAGPTITRASPPRRRWPTISCAAGLPVRERRWRGPGGEIDLICGGADGLVFVEVKKGAIMPGRWRASRRGSSTGSATSAEAYAAGMPRGSLTEMRIDLALVDAPGGSRSSRTRRCTDPIVRFPRPAPCRGRRQRRARMGLKVAIQMDPIGGIDIAADSTFRIAEEAQERGHGLFYYTPDRLSFRMGRILARGWPLTVRR